MFERLITITEDKFKNLTIIRPTELMVWSSEKELEETPVKDRVLKNTLDVNYVSLGRSYAKTGTLSGDTEKDCKSLCDTRVGKLVFSANNNKLLSLYVEKQNGEVKVYITYVYKQEENERDRELILRLNDSQNYSLELLEHRSMTYDFSCFYEYKYEIKKEFLEKLCTAETVEDNLETDISWQSTAKLIYNQAFDSEKYFDEINQFIEQINEIEEIAEIEENAYQEVAKKEKEEADSNTKTKKIVLLVIGIIAIILLILAL